MTKTREEKISIITAVYNVKDYLERCVNSVLNQTYKNIEHIIIEHDSTDGSDELCDKLAKTDKRIKVFHTKNGSVPNSWNIGLDNDLIGREPQFLLHLLHCINEVLVVRGILIVQADQTDLNLVVILILAACRNTEHRYKAEDQKHDLLHLNTPLLV